MKRPCNAYVMFVKDFMTKSARDFPSAKQAIAAGELFLMATMQHQLMMIII